MPCVDNNVGPHLVVDNAIVVDVRAPEPNAEHAPLVRRLMLLHDGTVARFVRTPGFANGGPFKLYHKFVLRPKNAPSKEHAYGERYAVLPSRPEHRHGDKPCGKARLNHVLIAVSTPAIARTDC
jgi:hypothetical protein